MAKDLALPRRVYKFINSRYLDDLKAFGRLRIGATEEFRVDDGKAGARNDVMDTAKAYEPGEGIQVLQPGHFLYDRMYPNGDGPTQPVPVHFGQGTRIVSLGQCLIFCTAHKLSQSLVRRMKSDFDCDAYFIIEDVEGFGTAISNHPDLEGREGGAGYVKYKNPTPEEILRGGEPDPFEKSYLYGWQREFRYAWWGKPYRDTGMVIDVPEILPLIRLV